MTRFIAGIAFLLRLGLRLDRRRLAISAALVISGYAATPLIGLALKALTDAALTDHISAAVDMGILLAILFVFELMLAHFAHLYYFELGELQEAELTTELMDIANGAQRLEYLNSAHFQDKLTLVREDLPLTFRALEAVLQLTGLGLQTAITTVILGVLNSWLLMLPLAAVPPVLATRRAQRVIEEAKESTAELTTLSRHLLELSTSVEAIKEIRLYRAERELLTRQDALWAQVTEALRRAHLLAAALRGGGQAIFAAAYGGAIVLLLRQSANGHASVGDVVLIITLAVQVSLQVAQILRLIASLQGTAKTVERIRALRQSAISPTESSARVSAPQRLEHGICLQDLGFAYQGASQSALSKVCLEIPAGSTVALVGENGAGKSTLVKLLCGLYLPTEGAIYIDRQDLNNIDPREWQRRVSALFQDFASFELRLRENVGLGERDLIGDDEAVREALRRAHADVVAEVVPGGLDGLVGTGYGDGTPLSGGQWQALGLARALIRTEPLLLVLDEPNAALDAAAEQAIFQMYRAAATAAADQLGTITLLVSHRLATASLADLIVVLNNGQITEVGTHSALLNRGGLYAELYRTQSKIYQ
ncbi:MAG TPA: ABC transporter ATP-binding protein [Streptosporangiaceae bacterium]